MSATNMWQGTRSRSAAPWLLKCCLAPLLVAGVWSVASRAQTFDSGSDGSDGALNIPSNAGGIVFDPTDSARWGRVLDADGDGVYNFTTISVGGGNTTLFINANTVVRPIYWLATGDITISGELNLDGSVGQQGNDLVARRQLSVPGAGGFAGGVGGIGSTVPATNGDGPGGGSAGAVSCGPVVGFCGAGGTLSANRYLLPLVGGSGGGGARSTVNSTFYSGGAGGGAILLASSTKITLAGGIYARGGAASSNAGGGGSGGSVRLVAPTIAFQSGTIGVNGGSSTSSGGAGLIRLERYVQTGAVNFNPNPGVVTTGTPVDAATLRPTNQLRVTAVAGVAVTNPTGSFVVPDVAINNGGPVPVDIAGTGIPPGTVVTLTVYPQTPADMNDVYITPVQVALTGTVAQTTATVNFTFPYGFSRGRIQATWTQ